MKWKICQKLSKEVILINNKSNDDKDNDKNNGINGNNMYTYLRVNLFLGAIFRKRCFPICIYSGRFKIFANCCIYIKSPDEWATTKQACRDELVVFFSHLYFALLPCIEHSFTSIKFHTLYIYIYIRYILAPSVLCPNLQLPAHELFFPDPDIIPVQQGLISVNGREPVFSLW